MWWKQVQLQGIGQANQKVVCSIYSQHTEHAIARGFGGSYAPMKILKLHTCPHENFKITHSEFESEGIFKNKTVQG